MAHGMTIGSLAKAAGVNVETIRYYQRLGLIDEPRKPLGGQRRYSDQTVAKLAFVRRGQQMGFTLAEIGELFHLSRSNGRDRVRTITEMRHSKLALHVEQLTRMSANLKTLLDASRRHRGKGTDPIIAALLGGDSPFGPAIPARPSAARRVVAASR